MFQPVSSEIFIAFEAPTALEVHHIVVGLNFVVSEPAAKELSLYDRLCDKSCYPRPFLIQPV